MSPLKWNDGNDDRIYKVEMIRDSKVYIKESLEGHK